MQLSLVAALSENRVIGRAGGLPWRLPDDFRHFRRVTMGHCLLMGRRTYESIGKPLPGRTTIVITRNPHFQPGHEDVIVVDSLDAAIDAARERGDDEACVAGGAEIYALSLPRADRLYLTRVHAHIEGDVHFPAFEEAAWECVAEARHPADERHAHAFTIETWERR